MTRSCVGSSSGKLKPETVTSCGDAEMGRRGGDTRETVGARNVSVRVEAVRALAQLGEMAVAVLRLRALIPGEDPEVLGQCFTALLAIERDRAIPFVAAFLEPGDDPAGEAAFALAEMRNPAALAVLLDRQKGMTDEWFGGVLLSAIAVWLLALAERLGLL